MIYAIQLRSDRDYQLGYPYNNDLDKLFAPLSDDEIQILGLDKDTINKISSTKQKFINNQK